MMDKLLLAVLNMSLTGAFVIALICLARAVLKKAPKVITYCLWAVAGFRLIIPFSIESVFSLMPFNSRPIPAFVATEPPGVMTGGINGINSGSIPLAEHINVFDPLTILIYIGAVVWIAGFLVMLIRGITSFIKLRRKMRGAEVIVANVYRADNIETPFVLGVLQPLIYIPAGLTESECRYIILHEQTHIKRRDHIVKVLAYFILCLHWFNPLAWAAFMLMGVDMEMSCDESVLREMGIQTKKDYSQSLLRLATQKPFVGCSSLAFGECGVKGRVKNILRFRKTSRVFTVTAVILVALFSFAFSVDRAAYSVIEEPLASSYFTYTVLDEYDEADSDNGAGASPNGYRRSASGSQRRNPREYMKFSASEINTSSLAKMLNNNILPYGNYYYSVTHMGDELLVAYSVIE